MISRNIEDHTDIGLNADWCISTYQMAKDIFIFDNENGTFTLCHVQPEPDGHYSGYEENYTNYYTGSFAECVKYFEEEVKK